MSELLQVKDNRYYRSVGPIPCYDTDVRFRLKPAAFMDLAQEMAYQAATRLGFGYDDLQKHNTVWVLSRMHIRFTGDMRWRDDAVIVTWHKGLDGLFFLRDFELQGKDGRAAVCATSSWLIIDQRTRHLVRSDQATDMVPAETAGTGDAIAEPCPKLSVPAGTELSPAGTHKVAYSDVDFIGHTNNARYVVWAMDCLDFETASRPVRDVYVNFNKETVPGAVVELFHAVLPSEAAETVHYVEGRVEGKVAFAVKMVF